MKTNLLYFALLAVALGVLGVFAWPRRSKENGAGEPLAKDKDAGEPLTFDEFVQYGRGNGGNIVNGMPWSFQFHGHAVSHENDQRYLVNTRDGTQNFTSGDLIALDHYGDVVIFHPA